MKLRAGQIVYVDNPGFPYDDWNGISCTVEAVAVGEGGRYVDAASDKQPDASAS